MTAPYIAAWNAARAAHDPYANRPDVVIDDDGMPWAEFGSYQHVYTGNSQEAQLIAGRVRRRMLHRDGDLTLLHKQLAMYGITSVAASMCAGVVWRRCGVDAALEFIEHVYYDQRP
jgi:hypothetical protein